MGGNKLISKERPSFLTLSSTMLFDECIKVVLFNPETELKRIAMELVKIPSDKALEIVGRQEGLYPFFDPFSAPFSSPRTWFAQGRFQFLQGGHSLCQTSFNASNLPLTELVGDIDHACQIKTPNGLTASMAGQILPPQGERRHGSVRFLDQLLVVGWRQCRDEVKILLYTAQDQRQAGKVKAPDMLCYWAVREAGMSIRSLAKRIEINAYGSAILLRERPIIREGIYTLLEGVFYLFTSVPPCTVHKA